LVTNTGTQTNVGSDATTGTNQRVGSNQTTESGTNEVARSGRHFGNIGNLTSQKQLLEEIELWKWNYVNTVLNDVKDFLCVDTYLNY
jgi:hypothetical protein